MKSFLSLIVLLFLITPKSFAQEAEVITSSEFFQLQKREPKLQILDIRTLPELEDGIIKNAVNIDFISEDFSKDILKLDPYSPILVYCASGRRSAKASKILIENGFSKVYDLEGGFNQWKENNEPISTYNN